MQRKSPPHLDGGRALCYNPLTRAAHRPGHCLGLSRAARLFSLHRAPSIVQLARKSTVAPVRNAECGMRNGECGMRNGECGMRNGECGVRNGECGVGNGECGVRNGECGMRSGECGLRMGRIGGAGGLLVSGRFSGRTNPHWAWPQWGYVRSPCVSRNLLPTTRPMRAWHPPARVCPSAGRSGTAAGARSGRCPIRAVPRSASSCAGRPATAAGR